jgi:hypothetical protein
MMITAIRRALVVFVILLAVGLAAPWRRPTVFVRAYEGVMGTSLEVKILATSEAAASRAESAVLEEIDREAGILSGYDATSEFRRWTASIGTPRQVSPELFDALARFDHWRERTNGALESVRRIRVPGLEGRGKDRPGARGCRPGGRGCLGETAALAARSVADDRHPSRRRTIDAQLLREEPDRRSGGGTRNGASRRARHRRERRRRPGHAGRLDGNGRHHRPTGERRQRPTAHVAFSARSRRGDKRRLSSAASTSTASTIPTSSIHGPEGRRAT